MPSTDTETSHLDGQASTVLSLRATHIPGIANCKQGSVSDVVEPNGCSRPWFAEIAEPGSLMMLLPVIGPVACSMPSLLCPSSGQLYWHPGNGMSALVDWASPAVQTVVSTAAVACGSPALSPTMQTGCTVLNARDALASPSIEVESVGVAFGADRQLMDCLQGVQNTAMMPHQHAACRITSGSFFLHGVQTDLWTHSHVLCHPFCPILSHFAIGGLQQPLDISCCSQLNC